MLRDPALEHANPRRAQRNGIDFDQRARSERARGFDPGVYSPSRDGYARIPARIRTQ